MSGRLGHSPLLGGRDMREQEKGERGSDEGSGDTSCSSVTRTLQRKEASSTQWRVEF